MFVNYFKKVFGNGKIHAYPLGEGEEGRPHPESPESLRDPVNQRGFRDGVRKILITSMGIFKEIRK
ncbi:hypothetical protein KAW08_06995, partial [bacterium]|nr:hypothetical protein [bacterium]